MQYKDPLEPPKVAPAEIGRNRQKTDTLFYPDPNSRSINDTSRVIRETIISEAPSCSVILTTLEVPFTIAIFFLILCYKKVCRHVTSITCKYNFYTFWHKNGKCMSGAEKNIVVYWTHACRFHVPTFKPEIQIWKRKRALLNLTRKLASTLLAQRHKQYFFFSNWGRC
jgi:hypothetical protein